MPEGFAVLGLCPPGGLNAYDFCEIAGAGFGLKGDLAVPIEAAVKATPEAKNRRPSKSANGADRRRAKKSP
jgi:hypothetical protein